MSSEKCDIFGGDTVYLLTLTQNICDADHRPKRSSTCRRLQLRS